MSFRSASRPLAVLLASLWIILLWDASGLDLPMARWAGGPEGFALRDNRTFVWVFHEVPRFASWICMAGLFVAIGRPFGALRSLAASERVQLALTVLASVLVVSLVKTTSRTSCPWDLQAFGGMASHVSHWAWGVTDGGPGRCFPAGHASAAFAYVGGWFALRRHAPRTARYWLCVALAMGFVLGLAQQWRGAHYMSHTLWSAWLCAAVGACVDLLAQALRRRRPSVGLPASKLNES